MSGFSVSEVRFISATPQDQARGLIGFLSFTLNGVFGVDGVTLRETSDGRLALSFPARRDRQGRDHPIFRPLDDETRRDLEQQILASFARLRAVGVPPCK